MRAGQSAKAAIFIITGNLENTVWTKVAAIY